MLRALKNKISGISGVKKTALLLCTVLLLTIGFGATYSYVVTGTPTLFNLFINGMNPDGDLVIQKTVSHPFGDTYTIPSDVIFTFEVDLGVNYAGETLKTSQGEKTADENGMITVTVAPGGRTTVYDIDEGTAVNVTETNIGEGFTPDARVQEIEIQKYQDNLLTFTNTYVPEKTDTSALSVSGVKTLVGRDWLEGDSFTFELEVNCDGTWESVGTQTITYELVEQPDPEDPEKTTLVPKADFDTFDFTELIRAYVFDTAGTYSFRVSEVEGTIGGLTYDKAESKFEILVGDADMDGYLEIQSITTTTAANTAIEGTAVTISFENKYAPVGSAEAYIEILKVLEDTSGQNMSPAGYTFELYDEENTLITTSDPTSSTGETSIRLVYEPTDAGKTFTYVLKETGAGQSEGALTYDDTEYKIQVTVVDNLDGTVSAYAYDWKETITDAPEDVPEAAPDDVPENASEDSLEGTSEDSLENVSQENPTETTETAEIPADATNTYQAAFTNRYDPVDATVDLTGKKTLSGRALTEGEFTFCLYKTGPDFALDAEARPIDTTVNTDVEGDNGYDVLAFDPLTFDQVGTYYYVVLEYDPTEDTAENSLDGVSTLGGVTYDHTRYLVTVVVTDKDGVLEAQTTITDQYGEAREIAFANSYAAKQAVLTLGGEKVLNGADRGDYTFRFELYLADEDFVAADEPFQTVSSNDDGLFVFKELSFSRTGTYRYIVVEDDTDAVEGMSYDDTVYQITVVITDPGDGQLIGQCTVMAGDEVVCQCVIPAEGATVNSLLFENSYTEPEIPTEPETPSEPETPDETEESTESSTEETTKPATPTKPSAPNEGDGTGTGDDSHLRLWIAMIALSAVTVAGLAVSGRRRRSQDE